MTVVQSLNLLRYITRRQSQAFLCMPRIIALIDARDIHYDIPVGCVWLTKSINCCVQRPLSISEMLGEPICKGRTVAVWGKLLPLLPLEIRKGHRLMIRRQSKPLRKEACFPWDRICHCLRCKKTCWHIFATARCHSQTLLAVSDKKVHVKLALEKVWEAVTFLQMGGL